MSDDWFDLMDMAESAEVVRGEHFTHWWPEVNRLEQAGQLVECEELLIEMRDAVEPGAQLAGWALAPAPATRLADLYVGLGDRAAAIAELERFIAAVDRCRKEEPEGGYTGYRNARKYLESLTGEQGSGAR